MVDRETEYQLVKLNDAYCRCLDEDKIEEWPNFFVEDGVYAIHPRENVDNGLEGYWMYCESKKMIRDRVTTLRNTSIKMPAHTSRFPGGGASCVGAVVV